MVSLPDFALGDVVDDVDLDSMVSAILAVHPSTGGSFARFYATAAQAIPNATDTTLTFSGNEKTSVDIVKVSTSVFRIAREGPWTISACCQWATGTTGRRALAIIKAGDTSIRYALDTRSAAGDFPAGSCSTSKYFVVGDEVSVIVWHNQGASLNTDVSYNATHVAFKWGPTG